MQPPMYGSKRITIANEGMDTRLNKHLALALYSSMGMTNPTERVRRRNGSVTARGCAK